MSEHTPEYSIEQALRSAQQWVEEAPTPEARDYRLQETVRILSSKEPIMHYYRDTGSINPPPPPESYDSAFWHGELDRVAKNMESPRQINEEERHA